LAESYELVEKVILSLPGPGGEKWGIPPRKGVSVSSGMMSSPESLSLPDSLSDPEEMAWVLKNLARKADA
jgi:hypothetical protein